MAPGSDRRLLPFVYLVPVTAVYVLLATVGYLLGRFPLLPAAVSRQYQRLMFAAILGLSRVVDGWMDEPVEPVVGGVTGESAP